MELVMVERQFEQPVKLEEIQSLETAGSARFPARVRFLKSFVSRDRRRILCLFEAPDAESVRDAEDQTKVPYSSIWTCTNLQGSAGPHSTNPSLEHVVVERLFPEAVTPDFVSNGIRQFGWCLDVHRAEHIESFLGSDGRRMVCLFRAPDAEAVRVANQKGGVPYSGVWTASVHSCEEIGE